MRAVAEAPHVMEAVDDACEKWTRADVAWDTVKWVLSHDPTKGVPLLEGGGTRALVYHGSWAHDMPTIYVEYEITEEKIIVQQALFRDAAATSGNA